MHVKVEHAKELSLSQEKAALVDKYLQAASFYVTGRFPYVTVDFRELYYIRELQFWYTREPVQQFSTATVKPLENIIHIRWPLEMSLQIGNGEYEVSHDFHFPEKRRKLVKTMRKFLHEPRSYELEHSIAEHFDRHEKLYRIKKVSTVHQVNVAHVAGPVLAYLQLCR